VLFNVGLIIV